MLRDPGQAPHLAPTSSSDAVSRPSSLASSRRTPSAKVAMIGAGQLARMTHQAAVDLDIDLVLRADVQDTAGATAHAERRVHIAWGTEVCGE